MTVHINWQAVSNQSASLRTAALVSLALVLPFMVLELVNTRGFSGGFPVALFIVMWVLPLAFILIGMPLVRGVPSGNGNLADGVKLLVRVTLLMVIAWLWVSLIRDQMPCFLGVPNCD